MMVPGNVITSNTIQIEQAVFIYQQLVKEKKSDKFDKEQGVVYGNIWMEGRERTSDIIILQYQK